MTVQTSDTTHPLGPLREPGQAGGLIDVFRRRYLLKLLVRKELRVRYQGSAVGLGWSYVQPLVRFCVYYFIAGLVVSHKTPHRALHIFCGLMMVQFFGNCMVAGTKSVIKNKSLVRKINMPREMFPVASVSVSLYHLFPMYVILFIGCFVSGWHPDALALLAMVMALAIMVLWGLGVALILSSLNVFLRDVSNVVEVISTVLRWTCPMIYPWTAIAGKLANHPVLYDLYVSHPLCAAVVLANRAFWIPSFSNIHSATIHQLPQHIFLRGGILLALGVVFLGIAQIIFRRLEGRFAEQL